MEIPKEQMEQRLNFNGDPSNPHSHDNGNGFNHFPPLDSGYALNHSVPRPLRKRPWHHSNQGTSPDQVDSANNVKVYVAPVPRTATEAEIRPVFEEHGTIIEVVLLKDKRTGVRQGSCFVKYATFDGADRAIKALNNQYTFVGESYPVVVKFADRELERLGVRGFCRNMEKKDPLEGVRGFCRNMEKKDPLEVVADKVFVSCFNKEASKKEIEEIFSPYGHVEDIFIATSRGYAFVKFSNREMALAAIKGLNRTFTMRGCDHPLIVRFADPKRPRTGEPRSNSVSVNANFGPCSQEPAVWPLPNFGDPNCGGSMLPIAPHHSSMAHPQVTTHMQNWEPGATVVQHPFPPQQLHSQLGSTPFGSIQAPKLPSQTQPFITEAQRQSHPADSLVQNIEQHLSSQLASQTGSNPSTAAGNTPPDMPSSPQDEDFPECDWSEHYCPDGVKYYYNCVTCESRWEKPEEYALYEKESQKQPELENNCCSLSQLSSCSSQQVAEKHQETNHDRRQSNTSPVVA
ncbi:flowering time control protein FCA isoform X1 [Vigna angularis]|uniref:flowering time control protein FCA isoform X1 n=1 Tax=Phaseolus angularis TaxID=3914 RepID=UPI0022B44383|nr:flowering time control protein FCA isoform X1 [Vigna angularis]